MASCPVCTNNNVFGEQVTYSDSILGFTFYDCPRCGAFRMNTEAVDAAAELEAGEIDRLLFWIREKNREGIIPLVNGGLVGVFLSSEGHASSLFAGASG